MKLEPLFSRVLLKREKLKTGSIILPESVSRRNAPSKGVAVAKGATADDAVTIGATYIFGQHAGAWINADGTPSAKEEDGEYFVCLDEDLIAEVVT